MKRKTFNRLRMAALSFLLVEAMMMLILLLAQAGASAEVSGDPGPSHKGTASGAGRGESVPAGQYTDNDGGASCGAACAPWNDAADAPGPYDGRPSNDFSGTGPVSHGGAGAQGGQGGGRTGDDGSRSFGPFFFGVQSGGGFPSSPNGSFGQTGSSGQNGSSGGDGSAGGGDSGGGTDSSGDPQGPGGFSDGLGNLSILDFATVPGDPDGPPGSNPPATTTDPAITPVPEPVTASLFVAGLAGTIILRRKRARQRG